MFYKRYKEGYLVGLKNNKFIIILFFLGICWTFVSPVSSAADDDYHLTSIWCVDRPNAYCNQLNLEKVLVPSELNAGLIPEKFTGLPPCYVEWPVYKNSAKCLENNSKTFVETTRFSKDNNSFFYYSILNRLVTSDVTVSVYFMRIFNLLVCLLFFYWCKVVLDFKFNSLLMLTWSVTIVPIGIFYLVSTNPSSWTITGIGIFWVVLLNIFHRLKQVKRVSQRMYFLLAGSALLALLARIDSIVYICLIIFTLILLNISNIMTRLRKDVKRKSKEAIRNKNIYLAVIISSIVLLGLYNFIKMKKVFEINLSFPSANMATNQPNALLNLLIELPSFMQSILGGQQPSWTQSRGELGRDFTYGAGWLEFSFPSAVGIILLACAFSISMKTLQESSRIKYASLLILIASIFLIMAISRGAWGFKDGSYFQPRYFVPVFIALVGITLYNENNVITIWNKVEKVTYAILISFATFLAWLQTLNRYSLGAGVPFTNIRTDSEWWYFPENEFKYVFVIFSLIVHIIWGTIVFSNPVKDIINSKLPSKIRK